MMKRRNKRFIIAIAERNEHPGSFRQAVAFPQTFLLLQKKKARTMPGHEEVL
jgi:hypothetical protein